MSLNFAKKGCSSLFRASVAATLLVFLIMAAGVSGDWTRTLFDVNIDELKQVISNHSSIFEVESWRSCGSANDSLAVKFFELAPDPPVIGRTVQVHLVGYLSKAIDSGAKVDIRIQRFNKMVYHVRFDLCGFLRLKQPQNPSLPTCPVAGEGGEGLLDLMHKEYIPKTIPKVNASTSQLIFGFLQGKYWIKASGTNADGSPLFCIFITIKCVQ